MSRTTAVSASWFECRSEMIASMFDSPVTSFRPFAGEQVRKNRRSGRAADAGRGRALQDLGEPRRGERRIVLVVVAPLAAVEGRDVDPDALLLRVLGPRPVAGLALDVAEVEGGGRART